MKRLIMTLAIAIIAVGMLSVPSSAPAVGQEPSGSSGPLQAFCGEVDLMEVAIVIDQSGSLRKTDPDNGRLEAGKLLIRNLDGLDVPVIVSISGFGDQFTRGRWIELDSSEHLDDAIGELEAIVEAELQSHTDYVIAMQGALDVFAERNDAGSCRTFVWFTDGHHDLGNPEDGKARPYDANLDRYEAIVGPQLAPDLTLEIENNEDATTVGALLDPLTCNPAGFADELVKNRIFTQVFLLDTTGEVAQDPSWQTIQALLRGEGSCGTHGVANPGEAITTNSIDEIAWEFSCLADPNAVTARFKGSDFPLSLADIGPGVPLGLVTEVGVRVFGDGGPSLVTSSGATSESSGNLSKLIEIFADSSGVSGPTESWRVTDESQSVVKACAILKATSPTISVTGDSGLRQAKPGGYELNVSGPYGKLNDADLRLLEELKSTPGIREGSSLRWSLASVPNPLEVTASVSGRGFPTVSMPPQTLNVLPPSKFPSVELSGTASLVGEGRGPFELPIVLNEGDGGELCLGTETIQVATHDGTVISGTVRFDSDERCVTDFASAPEALIVEFDNSAFVKGSKFGLDFVSTHDGESVSQNFDVPTTLKPVVDQSTRLGVTALIMLLILFMLWLVLYLVNRRSVRIPDLTNHRWYSFDPDRVDRFAIAPIDLNAARRPIRTSGDFEAGPLTGKRRVPILRVWRRPSIYVAMGREEFDASMSGRARRSNRGTIAMTRGMIEEGEIVAVSAKGGPNSGVLFTGQPKAGQDASEVFARQLGDGLAIIQAGRTGTM